VQQWRPPVQGVDQVDHPGRRFGKVEVDQRCWQAAAEHQVARAVVLVRDQLGLVEHGDDTCRSPTRDGAPHSVRGRHPALGCIVQPTDEGRQCDQYILPSRIVRERFQRHIAVNEGQDLSPDGVISEGPWGVAEAPAVQMRQIGLDRRGERTHRPANSVSDPDHLRHTFGGQQLFGDVDLDLLVHETTVCRQRERDGIAREDRIRAKCVGSAAPEVERVQSVEMDVLPGDTTAAIDEFVRARAETIRYHETLYRSTNLGAGGTWLAHPHPLVMDSLGLVTRPVHAYDLGAGVGRHALPIVAGLPSGSLVTAVDLIPSALASLVENAAAAGLSDRVETVNADLESWAFPADDAGLIIAFSALEHVSSLDAFCAVLERCRAATIPGGVNVIGIVADREEVSSSDVRQAALIELPLGGGQALSVLRRCFTGWEIHVDEAIPAAVTEVRNGALHELRSTLVKFVAQAPR